MSGTFRFIEEFQWFLMVLSVLPSRTFAISAHLFNMRLCIKKRIHSSSRVQLSFLILGLRWLCQRSLHYLPMRPGKCSAIVVHLSGPFFSTSIRTFQSSSSVHGPLIIIFFFFPPLVLRPLFYFYKHLKYWVLSSQNIQTRPHGQRLEWKLRIRNQKKVKIHIRRY